jgi:hypothetical protein
MEYETVPVETFIGRMIQHTVPKGFKRIRYYGVQATGWELKRGGSMSSRESFRR